MPDRDGISVEIDGILSPALPATVRTADGFDYGVGSGAHYRDIVQSHFVNALMKPFNTAFHRFHQSELVVRQAGGRHDTGESSTTADIRHRLELPLGRCFTDERYDGRGVQNMPFPNNTDIAWPYQPARLSFRSKFHVKHLQLAQCIVKHFLKNRRPIQFVIHITHAHHPNLQASKSAARNSRRFMFHVKLFQASSISSASSAAEALTYTVT